MKRLILFLFAFTLFFPKALHAEDAPFTALTLNTLWAKKNIVICGGGLIGCETALHLAQEGKDCTIIEMLPQVAGDCNFMHRMALMPELEKCVTMKTSHRVAKIEKNAVYAIDENGVEQKFDCDAVIVAMGLSPRAKEVNELRGIVAETYVIGDCAKSGRIMHATRAGWETALLIG